MHRKKPITLKTIADLMGVQPTTVSKALRNSNDVSEKTKQKAKQLAFELGYQPNLIARSLRKQKTNTIGAIVPEIVTSFHSDVIRGFYQEARSKGYQILLMISDEKFENEMNSVQFFSSLPVDGIAISLTQESHNNDYLDSLSERGMPIVFYDRVFENKQYSSVTSDNRGAVFDIIEGFIRSGRDKIAYVGPLEFPSSVHERFLGYQDALNANQLTIPPSWIVPSKIDEESAYLSMKQLLNVRNFPNAIFCATDLIALGVGRALLEKGIKIPEEVVLAGFGDCVVTSLLHVPILTVNQSPLEIGRRTIELLTDHIDAKFSNKLYSPRKVIIKSKIINDSILNCKKNP